LRRVGPFLRWALLRSSLFAYHLPVRSASTYDRIIYGVISNLNRSWERKPFFQFTQTT
jgi:hypothetical protein